MCVRPTPKLTPQFRMKSENEAAKSQCEVDRERQWQQIELKMEYNKMY